jgi:hypothetical protein
MSATLSLTSKPILSTELGHSIGEFQLPTFEPFIQRFINYTEPYNRSRPGLTLNHPVFTTPTSSTESDNLHIPIRLGSRPQDPSPSNQFKIYSIIPVFRQRPTWKKPSHCLTAFRRSFPNACVLPTHALCDTTRMHPFPQHLSSDPRKWKEKIHIREQISGSCLSFVPFTDRLLALQQSARRRTTNLRSAY